MLQTEEITVIPDMQHVTTEITVTVMDDDKPSSSHLSKLKVVINER